VFVCIVVVVFNMTVLFKTKNLPDFKKSCEELLDKYEICV